MQLYWLTCACISAADVLMSILTTDNWDDLQGVTEIHVILITAG